MRSSSKEKNKDSRDVAKAAHAHKSHDEREKNNNKQHEHGRTSYHRQRSRRMRETSRERETSRSHTSHHDKKSSNDQRHRPEDNRHDHHSRRSPKRDKHSDKHNDHSRRRTTSEGEKKRDRSPGHKTRKRLISNEQDEHKRRKTPVDETLNSPAKRLRTTSSTSSTGDGETLVKKLFHPHSLVSEHPKIQIQLNPHAPSDRAPLFRINIPVVERSKDAPMFGKVNSFKNSSPVEPNDSVISNKEIHSQGKMYGPEQPLLEEEKAPTEPIHGAAVIKEEIPNQEFSHVGLVAVKKEPDDVDIDPSVFLTPPRSVGTLERIDIKEELEDMELMDESNSPWITDEEEYKYGRNNNSSLYNYSDLPMMPPAVSHRSIKTESQPHTPIVLPELVEENDNEVEKYDILEIPAPPAAMELLKPVLPLFKYCTVVLDKKYIQHIGPPPPPPESTKPDPTRPRVKRWPPLALEEKKEWASDVFKEKYSIESKILDGEFGPVFKAKVKDTKTLVVVRKVSASHKEGFPMTAIREIKTLRQFNHPNIVKLMDVVTDKRQAHMASSQRTNFFLIFEHVQHDLAGLFMAIRDDMMKDFTDLQKQCLFKQILQALEYCHQKNFIHRNLKKSHILINNRYEVKVAGWGLARFHEASRPYANNVTSLGYRAPELLLGEMKYDTAVDIWSAGCILAEFFTKRRIFAGKSVHEQLEAISKECGTPRTEVWPNVDKLPYFEELDKETTYFRRLKIHYMKILPADALDLLDKMLVLDPKTRITAVDALRHPWMKDIKPENMLPFGIPYKQECNVAWSRLPKKERQAEILDNPQPQADPKELLALESLVRIVKTMRIEVEKKKTEVKKEIEVKKETVVKKEIVVKQEPEELQAKPRPTVPPPPPPRVARPVLLPSPLVKIVKKQGPRTPPYPPQKQGPRTPPYPPPALSPPSTPFFFPPQPPQRETFFHRPQRAFSSIPTFHNHTPEFSPRFLPPQRRMSPIKDFHHHGSYHHHDWDPRYH